MSMARSIQIVENQMQQPQQQHHYQQQSQQQEQQQTVKNLIKLKEISFAKDNSVEIVNETDIDNTTNLVPMQIMPDKPYLTASRSYLAKLNWWNTPIQPLELNKSIETALANNHLLPKMAETASTTAINMNDELNADDHCNGNDDEKLLESISNAIITNVSNTKNMQQLKLKDNATNAAHNSPSTKSVVSRNHSYQRRRQRHQFSDDETYSLDSELLVKDNKSCFGLLNPDEEDEMKVTGYHRSKLRTTICWLCILLTGGLLRLIMHWWRHWYLIGTHKPCPLDEAEKVLIQEDYQEKHKVYYVKRIFNLKATDFSSSELTSQYCPQVEYEDYCSKNEKKSASQKPQQQQQRDSNCNNFLTVHFSSAHFKRKESVRIFNCKQLRYAWDSQTQCFRKLTGLDHNILSSYFHQQKGLSEQEQQSRRLVFGPNEISVPYKNVMTLLCLEVLNPFYVFQIFSVVLWFAYDYYYYACVIVLMSVFGITMSIIQTKKNQDALRKTVLNSGCVQVINDDGSVRELPTQSLVPGDMIQIPKNGCTMHCDAVLLSGNCIVDESMLTGESVPVTKTPLPMKRDSLFDKKEHARHTLFCGTKVIQTRYIGSEKVLAIVINTGNITAKGGLVRSILYPPPVDYKFEQDSYKFIEVLGLIAMVGFIYTLVTKILRNVDPVKIAVESLDLITIVVPPALPAAMTVGRFYAQKRLKKSNIYCISPRSINVAGSIDCCCFDKTGTLTEDGLDMWGVVPKSATNQFQIPIKDIDRLPCDHFLFGMATCHSITTLNGKMMGDPLDLKMFESTGWILEDTKEIPDNQKYDVIHPTIVRPPPKKVTEELDNAAAMKLEQPQRQSSMDDLLADVGLDVFGEKSNDHGIVREFPFTSNLQRMSVITRRLNENHFNVYCKGSPEMLQQLCMPSSLPDNYSQQLAVFAKQGYRIIALAYKPLRRKVTYTKILRLTRESVESDLEFLGFVVMENRLKPDTTDVITALTAANIRTIMVTGDNILTAVSVARDCGIVSPTQAVITVNVRHKHKGGAPMEAHSDTESNYELFYTLELGNECTNVTLNGHGNGDGIKQSISFDDTTVNSCHQLMNGDVSSLHNSTLENSLSNSLTSIKTCDTCDTWTHQDVELGLKTQFDVNNTKAAFERQNSWRQSYRFAMVGNTWQIVREHFPEQLRCFITRGAIFARMSPDQKQALIIELQGIEYSVAMCGDGANDCGALKVAQTGISLSETESSIASPFTSRNPTIASVPTVIKEGRAALVTSFGIFKYMAAYSMVQFISVMILYSIDSNLTDKQYLYIDLGMISIFAFFFGKTESFDGPLVKQVPLSSLISLAPLASIVLHLFVVVCFQVAGWFQLHDQPWFVPFSPSDEQHLGCFENYAMFAISSFQYISLAFVFSKGAPYRKPIYANVPFCLALLINLAIVVYMVAYPAQWLADFFQLIVPPAMGFRYWMLIYGALNFIAHVFIETFIVEFLLLKKVYERKQQNLQTSKLKHMQIEYELRQLRTWPAITDNYETYDHLPQERDDMAKPTYVEISAEQDIDFATPTNNALSSFFDGATPNANSGDHTPQNTIT